MNHSLRQRQVPGRIEALRIVLAGQQSTPLLRHIAGLDKITQAQPRRPSFGTCDAGTNGLDSLTADQRAALPF